MVLVGQRRDKPLNSKMQLEEDREISEIESSTGACLMKGLGGLVRLEALMR